MLRPSVLLLLTLLLGGCALGAATPVRNGAEAVSPPFAPLSPASYGGSVQLEQVLHAAYGARESTLQCFVDISPERLTVVGVTALGQRVFSIEFDGNTLKAERAPFAPAQVSPERILGDLQFAFWPLAAVQAAVANSDWRISEPRSGLRRLQHGDTLVAETHHSAGNGIPARLWLTNLRDGYTLDIETRVPGPAP